CAGSARSAESLRCVSLVPKDWIRDFMARPSYGQSGDEFVERLDRDEPSTANLDGLELPSGNELVGAGAAEPPTVLIAIRVVHVGLHHATSQAADIGWQRTYFHRCSQFTSTACGSCISDGLKRASRLRF